MSTVQNKNRRSLNVHSLEAREVPAIMLSGTELVVSGGNDNDSVTISINNQGTANPADDKVTASRISTTTGPIVGVFPESKTFDLAKVKSVRVLLGNGANSFENQTHLKSIVVGGSGVDQMTGGSGVDIFIGGAGNDQLYGGEGNDIISGGIGNDLIAGDGGTDKLYGDADNDTIWGFRAYASTSSEDGNNVIEGGTGNDSLRGAAGNDTINGGIGEDYLFGGNGNDLLNGQQHDDYIAGQDGNDTITGGDGNDLVDAGDDNDSVFGGNGMDTLNGGYGNDTLKGDNQNDELNGGDGDDLLCGGNHNDTLKGNDGNDQLNGDGGEDFLVGGEGTDMSRGGTGRDTIIAIDGSADLFFGNTTLSNTERDNFWVDSLDAYSGLPTLNVAKSIDPDSVHVVSNFRSYSVNGVPTNVSINAEVGNLPDPTRQTGDSGTLANLKFLPLFNSAGPKYTDIDQGSVGSCYFLARLASLARTNPQFIRDMVTELGDGSFAVQFYDQDGEKVFVRVDADFWTKTDGSLLYASTGGGQSLWVAVIEKAWAIHRYGTASYNDINGGTSDVNTSLAMGLNHQAYESANYSTPIAFVNQIRTLLNQGRAVMLGSVASLSDFTPKTEENKARGQHVFMVHSVQTNAQGIPTKVVLYNLYGGELTEITRLDVLHWCSSAVAAVWEK